MKVKEVIRILKANGFRLSRIRGSHRRFEGEVSGIRHLVTVAGNESKDLTRSTLSSIRRQSGLPRRAPSVRRGLANEMEW